MPEITILDWLCDTHDLDLGDIDCSISIVKENPGCHHRLIDLPDDHVLDEPSVVVVWNGNAEVTDADLAVAVADDYN